MCIRDRQAIKCVSYQFLQCFLFDGFFASAADVLQTAHLAQSLAGGAHPVSYTHLDVYKRQAQRSNDTFALKAGTLYPILHALEADGSIESYEQPGGAATRCV